MATKFYDSALEAWRAYNRPRSDDMPTRMTPQFWMSHVEIAIHEAMAAVGPSDRTTALNKALAQLARAQECVAQYVESVGGASPSPSMSQTESSHPVPPTSPTDQVVAIVDELASLVEKLSAGTTHRGRGRDLALRAGALYQTCKLGAADPAVVIDSDTKADVPRMLHGRYGNRFPAVMIAYDGVRYGQVRIAGFPGECLVDVAYFYRCGGTHGIPLTFSQEELSKLPKIMTDIPTPVQD